MKNIIKDIKGMVRQAIHSAPVGKVGMGLAILAFASCTDSWDEHYNPSDASSATETLWEQITANPKLKRFAAIAEKATYYKDQSHPLKNPTTGKPYTYKDMFSGTQLMTVWAPEDDAISESDYEKWMEMAESNPYTLHQQFMANSVALWRSVANGTGTDTLQMINGKRLLFDKSELTMQNVELNQKNIEASNGTLHTLTATLPFEYNLYEYLKDADNAQANNVMRFHDYIIDTDTTYFNEGNSIEGNPDPNGNPTYVDSAYTNTNMMFFNSKRTTLSSPDKNLTFMESFGANIEGEDSDFIMVIPTDAAWQAAYEKLAPLYKYANYYVDSEKGNSHVDATREITDEMMDSITNQSINMDIISPIVFNAHKQPKRSVSANLWTAQELLEAPDANIEYLLNTFGDTLRTDASWQKTDLWAGKKAVKMSNGYGVVSNVWDFPRKLYQPNLNIEIGWQSWYDSQYFTGTSTAYSFSNSVAQAWVDTVGRVSFNNFYDLRPNGDSNPIKFVFKLVGTDGENRESEVMSGTYDIGIVCVPDFYKTSTDTIEGDTVRHKITATLNYCNNESKSGAAKNTVLKIANKDAVLYDGEKVDTVWLFKDFTFPYSYKNLRYSWPTLELGTYSTSAERKVMYFDPENPSVTKDAAALAKMSEEERAKYTGKIPAIANNLCIDRIVLVAKEPKTE